MEYRTRKMVMDKDLNPAGTLFGGRALEWIDEEAAIFAYCQLKYPIHLVTKVMSTIDFKAPARKGEIVEIGMEVVKVGKTSITVGCSLRNKRTQQEIVKVAEIVFVNLDETGKPAPHNHYQLPENFKAVTQNAVVGELTPKLTSPGVSVTIVDVDQWCNQCKNGHCSCHGVRYE